ncbi:serine/threonine protein kinase [Frankia sp. CcI49]|uniref:serine/threonine-protein kinase n=1 Tax=Frankia sp. CcI49 TaxID=1745382 RepID=UPI000975FD89|nr:serine/threonine-protein kinase [Frankia sp. CcI49]ONH56220.1 serine/threonine protein kinase [Frankia sp. CcI49]
MLTPLVAGDPRRIGPFEIHNRIGAGGMGSVYLGFTAEGRAAAVKVPAEGLAGDPEFRARFRREVEAARRVRGRAVAAVVDADPDASSPWMAVEYVEGTSLADAVIRHGPLERRLLHGFGVGLADALVAIHAVGVVHRDLKPTNILLAWDGPKVIDFGIARASGTPTHTHTGILVGTPSWMAPEQLRGERATPAADVFAWGACVTYAATGHPPFGTGDPADVLTVLHRDEQPDLAGVPANLMGAVRATLSRRPEDRPTAVELVRSLVSDVAGDGVPDPSRVAAIAQTSWQWDPHAPAAPAPRPPDAPGALGGGGQAGGAAGAGGASGVAGAGAGGAAGGGHAGGSGRPGAARTPAVGAAAAAGRAGSRAIDRPTQPLTARPDLPFWEEPPGGDSSLGTIPVPRLTGLIDPRNEVTDPSIRPRAGATAPAHAATGTGTGTTAGTGTGTAAGAKPATAGTRSAGKPAAASSAAAAAKPAKTAGGARPTVPTSGVPTAGTAKSATADPHDPGTPSRASQPVVAGAGGDGQLWAGWPPAARLWLAKLTTTRRRDRAAMVAAVVAIGIVVGAVVALTAMDSQRAEGSPGSPTPEPSSSLGVTTSPVFTPASQPAAVVTLAAAHTSRPNGWPDELAMADEPGAGPGHAAGQPDDPRTQPAPQATPTGSVSPTPDAPAPTSTSGSPKPTSTPCPSNGRVDELATNATISPC